MYNAMYVCEDSTIFVNNKRKMQSDAVKHGGDS